ncbi:ABC transporter permease [Haloferula sp.]|uniref:ABC transporter permease n=1 Tax=Haloferula sp. TaxID=2497595 RepID=UPI00329EA80E
MSGSLFLAWQYLRRNPLITGVLTAALTLIILLPAVLLLVFDHASRHMLARAESTPLVLGAKGSPLELVLGTLYFGEPSPQVIRMSQINRLREMDHGTVIPMHTGVRIRGAVLVGTTNDYFSLRKLGIAHGKGTSNPGECVIGDEVSRRLGIQEGDTLVASDPRAFNLQEAPLQLRVAGVLRRTETADDQAIFVDLKTVWIVKGLGHGHDEEAGHGTEAGKKHTTITPGNLASFHFHGDEDELPVTAAIVLPKDSKARTLMLGEFLSPEETIQLIRPDEVMQSLFSTVLTIRRYVASLVGTVSLVTLGVIALVIALSIRLRRGEIETMKKIGCARHTVLLILTVQILLILLVSTAIAAGLTGLAYAFGDELMRWLILR